MDSGSAKPFFLLDIAGDYVVRLIVNDGEKDSDPVDSTISAVVPASTGPVLKFAIVETTATPDPGRLGRYDSCDAARPDTYLADFWSPNLNAQTCHALTGLPADFVNNTRISGSLPFSGSGVASGLLGLHTNFTAGTFPSGTVPTPVGISYEASTNLAGIAPTPIGKSAGFSLDYAVRGYSMSTQVGPGPKASYRIVGSVAPQNAPQGWEAVVETTVKIDVSGYNSGTSSSNFNVYSKKFTADFSDTVEIELNAGAYPSFTGNQALYDIAVSHQVAYRRKAN